MSDLIGPVPRQTLAERVTALVFIAALSFACFKVAQPFLAPTIGGTVLCVSLWPFYVKLTQWLGGRRKLASTLLTVFTAMVFVIPVGIGTSKLIDSVPALERYASDPTWLNPGEPPKWFQKVPVVGTKLTDSWEQGLEKLKLLEPEKVRPVLLQSLRWVLEEGAGFALTMLQIILATVIAGFLFVHGEDAERMLTKFAARIGGEQSTPVIDVAGKTIRGVALGVVGTAFFQALLSGFGFALAGIPLYSLLALICFMLALMQIGTGLVWLPVAIWLGTHDSQGWAVFTVVLGVFINTMDNFIKPYFMSRGSNLPLLLMFTGVIGGLLAWGFMGMFIGATLLAVAYTLFCEWLDYERAA